MKNKSSSQVYHEKFLRIFFTRGIVFLLGIIFLFSFVSSVTLNSGIVLNTSVSSSSVNFSVNVSNFTIEQNYILLNSINFTNSHSPF